MAPPVPTIEPTTLTAGDSAWWDRTVDDYPPADGWALAYTLFGPSAAPLAIPTTVVSGVFQARVAAADTAELPAGTYTLVGRVTSGGDSFQVYRGRVHVLTNPAQVTTETDHVDAMVAALRAVLVTLATQPRATVVVNGRTSEFRDPEAVQRLLAYYENRQAVLRTGSLTGPSIAVEFRAPR